MSNPKRKPAAKPRKGCDCLRCLVVGNGLLEPASKPAAKPRCRHGRSWLIAGATMEWCYECGALRRLREVPPNACAPSGYWTRPTGKDGANPWEHFDKPLARPARMGKGRTK